MAEDGIIGLDGLILVFKDLPDNLQKKVLQNWTMAKSRQVAAAAKAAAPQGLTGNLKKGIAARRSGKRTLAKHGSLARAVVIGKRPAHHFHLVNLGTGPRRGGTPLRFTGSMPSNPFLERAAKPILEQARAEVKGDLAREVQKLLNGAVKRTMRHVR